VNIYLSTNVGYETKDNNMEIVMPGHRMGSIEAAGMIIIRSEISGVDHKESRLGNEHIKLINL